MTTPSPPPPSLDLATGPGAPDDARPRRVAPLVTAGVAVAVTALVAGGLAIGGRGPLAGVVGSGPDVLHIGAGYPGGGSQDVVSDPKGSRAGRYVLTGSLPGSPTSGAAWWLRDGSIDEPQVVALAGTLGLTAAPMRQGDDWVVRDGGAVLRVYGQPGLPFAFDASADDNACPSMPTDGYGGPDTAVGCIMTDPAPTTAPPPGPDEADLRDLARSVSGALGADAAITVWRGTPTGSVVLDPVVDGVPTAGAGVSVQASTDGVLAASGWLGAFVGSGQVRGDTYPLRAAKDVFGDLAAMPEPAMACPEDQGGSPMCGGDVVVTGATYGLTLAFDQGRPVLVPAWLFAVRGSDTPMARVAVDPRYLADPAGSGSGSGGGGSGSTGGDPGVGTEPAPGTEPGTKPVGVDPSAPEASDLPLVVDPAGAPGQDPGVGATPGGPVMPGGTVTWTGPRSLTLNLTGGCWLKTAVAYAKTTPSSIMLSYTFYPVPCPNAPASVTAVPVDLDEDPAGRQVVDEEGTPIPVVADGR